MLNRKGRTMDLYMKAGAEMRLYRTLGGRLLMDISKVLSAPDQDRLMRALRRIDQIAFAAEDNMFRDYPELSNDYLDVFSGTTDIEQGKDIDRKMIELARETADGLFKREKR